MLTTLKNLTLFIASLGCLLLLLGCTSYGCGSDCCGNSPCYSGPYSCTTNEYTSPSICNSACPDPCDMQCANNNFNYRGCGDNCVQP